MIDEADVRAMLRRRADGIPALPRQTPTAIRRGRRKIVRTVTTACLAMVVAAAGLVSAPRMLERFEPAPADGPFRILHMPSSGFVGLPPPGAEPSAPVTGTLLISFHIDCCEARDVYVYADGRVIWRTNPGGLHASDGYVEQRLTPAGAESLRATLLASGLFERDSTFVPDLALNGMVVAVRNADRMVTLRATAVPPDTPVVDETISRIATILQDPERALPSDAWADSKIRRFVPRAYFVVGRNCRRVSTENARRISANLAAATNRVEPIGRGTKDPNGPVEFYVWGGSWRAAESPWPPDAADVSLQAALPHETACPS